MTEPERFFFVHLQKTAGTSLFFRLRRHFGRDAVYPTPEHDGTDWANTDVDVLRDAFERDGDRIKAVVGHFPLCTVDLLGVPFTTLTVLRDPYERTLSFLRHRREKLSRGDATLLELYNDKRTFFALVHNHMTKMLGLTPELMTDGMTSMVTFDEAFLRRAEEALERVDVVGVHDRFDDFWAELEARFGWDLGDQPRANVTTAAPDDVDPRLERRIPIDNELDYRLYRYAADLVERRAGT